MDKFGKVIKTTMSNGLNTGKGGGSMDNLNYSIFPDKKLKVGDTWESEVEQNMNGPIAVIKTKYKLVSITDGIAEISMDGTLGIKENTEGKISGTQKGTSKIDIATGMNKSITLDQDIDMEMNDMGMKMPMKVKNNITITTK
jgi:hypothetical protein